MKSKVNPPSKLSSIPEPWHIISESPNAVLKAVGLVDLHDLATLLRKITNENLNDVSRSL
jgi:hypothetical protein